MPNTIQLRNSVVENRVPAAGDLVIGEVCVGANSASPMLMFKDNADNIIKIEPGGGVSPGPNPPSDPTPGQLWYDDQNSSLNYWDGTQWVELAASTGTDVVSVNGQTGVVVLDAGDVGAATTAQGALADSAIQPGVVNPVYFANEADFPDPALPSVHGGVAHSHAANAMFYAHNAQWLQLANVADTVPLGSWSSIPALT